MAYRPSSKPLQTAWARHLDNIRRERDWSATQLFEYVREPLKLAPKSRSAFVGQLDRDPRPSYLPVLRSLFGDPPAEPAPTTREPGQSTDVTRLVEAVTAALEAQTRYLTQIADLRAELADERASAQEQREAQADQLGRLEAELIALRDLVRSPSGSAQPAPGRN